MDHTPACFFNCGDDSCNRSSSWDCTTGNARFQTQRHKRQTRQRARRQGDARSTFAFWSEHQRRITNYRSFVNVTENSSGSTSVAVTFDAIQEKDRTTPMKTGLLALATMDNVHHAQLPISANSDRILSVSGPRAKLVETLCGVGSAR